MRTARLIKWQTSMPVVYRLRILVWSLIAVWGPSGIEAAERPRIELAARGHTAKIGKIMFTPDSQRVITVSYDKTIRIWDVASGETRHTLRLPSGAYNEGLLYAAALSPDGESLAVGGLTKNGEIYLISLSKLVITRTFKGHEDGVSDLAYSADGLRLISGGLDNTARVWRIADGQCEYVLRGHTDVIDGVAFSPDGQKCVTSSYDSTAIIWAIPLDAKVKKLREPKQLAVLRGHVLFIYSIAWSPDGRLIATGGHDQTIRLWDADGKELKVFDKIGPYEFLSLTFTADSKRLLFTTLSNKRSDLAGFLDVASGNTMMKFEKHTNSINTGDLSPDQTIAATCAGTGEMYIWRTADGHVLRKIEGQSECPLDAMWSDDGDTVFWNYSHRTGTGARVKYNRGFNIANLEFAKGPDEEFPPARIKLGTVRLEKSGTTNVDVYRGGAKESTLYFSSEYDRKYNDVNSFTILSEERAAVATSFGLYLFDTRTSKELRSFSGHASTVSSVRADSKDRYLLTASHDMTVRIWLPDRIDPLLSLFFVHNDWVAWTPEGYYAASPGGEQLLGWQVNAGPNKLAAFYPASQFRATYYRPDVIKLLLSTSSLERAIAFADQAGGRKTELTDIATILPPTVAIATPKDDALTVDAEELIVRAAAQQVGRNPITSIQVILDGRPLGGPGGIRQFKTPQRRVSENLVVPLEPGAKHSIQVRADSAVSYGLSRRIEVNRKATKTGVRLPSLYVLAIGVNEYQMPDLNLMFADEDARRIDRLFRENSPGAFEKIETKLILNQDATHAGVQAGLNWLAKQMSRHDVGVIFFSGQGARDATGSFYLMPCDANPKDSKTTGISDKQLKSALQGISGKLLLMLDASRSRPSSKLEAPSGDKKVPAKQKSLTDELVRDLATDDYGVIVMSATIGNELSQDSTEEKCGLFTLALIEALSGKADVNSDKMVHSNELEEYVTERVKLLSKDQQHAITVKPATIRPFQLTRIMQP